ncbi:MAG: hypothetical protein KDE23_17585 [Caldilinea sp.]|nr:hypothetical protein [Caldilinea sp.]
MSFGYSEDFTAEAAQERLQLAAPAGELEIIEGRLVSRRFEWTVGTIYVVSMLAVVIWGIVHGDLDVAILAASGLASISLVMLFNSDAWNNGKRL